MRSTITKKEEWKPPLFKVAPLTTGGRGGKQNSELDHVRLPYTQEENYVGKSYCMSGCTSDHLPARRHLEGVDKRPVGVRHCKGLSDRLPFRTSSEGKTSHSTLFCRTEPTNSGGGTGTPKQMSNRKDSQPSERVLFKPLSYTQKENYVGKSYCMSGCNPSDIRPSASQKAPGRC